MFRGHLFDALRLIERGDLRAEEMIGSWAGELGQTQMMPSEYMAHAIDYDGDVKRNLTESAADAIGSIGKQLVHIGWNQGYSRRLAGDVLLSQSRPGVPVRSYHLTTTER